MARRSPTALTMAVAAVPLFAAARHAAAGGGVVVEQIEAYEVDGNDDPKNPTRYAPVNYAGSATLTPTTGDFAGITLHADTSLPGATPGTASTPTSSIHATYVAQLAVGANNGSPAGRLVSDLYNTEADQFLTGVLQLSPTATALPGTGVGAAPPPFAGGASVVNNSWVGDFEAGTDAQLNAQRRIDFMVARADVTFVAAAATGISTNQTTGATDFDPLVWSGFNALAVSGQQGFNPAGSPGKAHADLGMPTFEASFATAVVSGYAAGLVGRASAAGQPDATRGTVVRSLLMAGADKSIYARQTANNLDAVHGAGLPSYDPSLAILQGGERTLAAVSGGSTATPPVGQQQGWTAGTVPAGGQSAVVFSAAQTVTGLTASLNWDVTSQTTSDGQINTSSGAVIFPNLTLEVRPVTLTAGKYVLGTALSDVTFHSAATGDNVQYLYATNPLPAGTYAFLIGGDAALPATVGFSYALRGSFASAYTSTAGGSWGTPTSWSNGIPNAPAAVATIASPTSAATLTLDGDRRVGQLNLAASAGVTIATGSGGTLTIDDAGNSAGTARPTIAVRAGTGTITAPVALANGVAVNLAANAALTLAGPVTGTGGLTLSGLAGGTTGGTLTLSAANAYGDTTVAAGTLALTSSATLNGGLTVTGGRATFAPATAGGVSPRTLTSLTIGPSGSVVLTPAATSATRTVLVTSALSLGGRLDLGNGDLIVHNGSLSDVTAAAATGFAGGTWAGPGLASAAAAGDPAHLTAVGVIANTAGLATFDGQAVTSADVLVRYTYYGDADLNGVVNAADYSRIDTGFLNHAAGWGYGDFNYDGVIDGSDYTLIDSAFNLQGGGVAAPTAQVVGAVPEPAGVAAVAAAVLSGRRRAGRDRRRAGASSSTSRQAGV